MSGAGVGDGARAGGAGGGAGFDGAGVGGAGGGAGFDGAGVDGAGVDGAGEIDPMSLLLDWLPANDEVDRPQATLATVSPGGWPDARTVLLSSAGPDGVSFHTDAHSRKVADIEADPRVALTVLWPGFTRQLVIRGIAECAAPDDLAAAYRRRSPYLQQLAWQNTPDFALLAPAERMLRWAAFTAEHPLGFDQPDNWAGFLVRPVRVTFWESNTDAASRRLEYTLADGRWTLEALPG